RLSPPRRRELGDAAEGAMRPSRTSPLRRALLLLARLLPVAILAATAAGTAGGSPAPMTRDAILSNATTVVGFRHWWGGRQGRPGSRDKGKCGPWSGHRRWLECNRYGSWGADCSGFAGKAWQVPSPIALTTASHPYVASNWTHSATYWTVISRGS